MAQRLWIELDRLNHQVYVQLSASGKIMIEGVNTFKPDIIVAPFLTVKIPAQIYENYVCLIVHPGIVGDRGASSLDWAILRNEKYWGVSILEAAKKMDAGDVWSFQPFEMRDVSKGQLYRNEVTQAASKGILETINKFDEGQKPIPAIDYKVSKKGKWNNKIIQKDIHFQWTDKAKNILTKINAADSSPGVLALILEEEYYVYGAHFESVLTGSPGDIIGQRDDAICIACQDAAIWLTHLKSSSLKAIKVPATLALKEKKGTIPMLLSSPFNETQYTGWQEIKFIQKGEIGYLYFDFYNGAMSTNQCIRLKEAIIESKKKDIKVIALMGGEDVWSNGIHLNVIENALNSADESWANINAIDDLILEIINSTDHYIIAALQGNAGAGGVSLALTADKVLARNGVVINPHTKNMGLYGSEYWTYLLPKRIGIEKAKHFTEDCLPWGVEVSKEIGLIDDFFGETNKAFREYVSQQAQKIADLSYFDKLIKAKQFQRKKDERNKPLASYREEELANMYLNFYEDNQEYAYKRHCFVHKIPINKTTEDLYSSRRKIYRKRKWESIEYKNE